MFFYNWQFVVALSFTAAENVSFRLTVNDREEQFYIPISVLGEVHHKHSIEGIYENVQSCSQMIT